MPVRERTAELRMKQSYESCSWPRDSNRNGRPERIKNWTASLFVKKRTVQGQVGRTYAFKIKEGFRERSFIAKNFKRDDWIFLNVESALSNVVSKYSTMIHGSISGFISFQLVKI